MYLGQCSRWLSGSVSGWGVTMSETDGMLVHLWQRCHHCGMKPIVGDRFHCDTCPEGPDSDLCRGCYENYPDGGVSHPGEGVFHGAKEGIHRFTLSKGVPKQRYAPWLSFGHPPNPTPSVAPGFLVRPEFCSGFESTFGSYGFVVSMARFSKPLVLTALHVMDEMIKKKGLNCSLDNPNYSGRELPEVITRVNLYNVLEQRWMLYLLGEASPMLVLADARLGEEEPRSQRDIAAFSVAEGGDFGPAALARCNPKPGEPVWLAAYFGPGGPSTAKAVVVEITSNSFIYKYEGSRPLPPYTSGAPVLNREGAVVGINVGGGTLDGALFGHGNHVENIRAHLAAAPLP